MTSANAGHLHVRAGVLATHNGWTPHPCAIVGRMDRTTLSPLLRSFERHLRAENRSARTIATYLQSVQQAEAFLHAHGHDLAGATRADLEGFLGDLASRRAPATVWTRYKALRILYRWLAEEDEIGRASCRERVLRLV